MCLVRFSFDAILGVEPERYLIEVTAGAYGFYDGGEEVVFGKDRCFFADLEEAVDKLGDGPAYIRDMEGATADYIEPLFVPGRIEFRPDVVELLDEDPIGFNLLILDRLKTLPRCRRKKLLQKSSSPISRA